jgi:putative ABC transport system ATP-binding protein
MIELSHITKSYTLWAEEVPVLKDVSLNISSGDFVAIMGPSGSGKSTLMNIIGLLDVPTSGTYVLDGTDTSKLDDTALTRFRGDSIGFVFQGYNLIPRMRAIDQVSLPLSYRGTSLAQRKRLAQEALTRVWLAEKLESLPNELSGGQQQRVAIARAIVTGPRLILADEPTGALDTKTGREIMELFQALNKEGITIILITHSDEVAQIASRMVKIRDGSII